MTPEEIIKPENHVYGKPALLNDTPMHYCPGCSHGVVHKLVAEIIKEMDVEERTVGICPVGCAVFAYRYVDVDWIEAAHGRAPASASAVKRLWPDHLVFTYQGDGDLACIGTGETIQALNRGENIAIIFINNAIYGMTGGQMAPTTLMGMKTSTCPYGRQADLHGYPLHITDIAATLEGTCYVTRQAVDSVAHIQKAKRAIRQAFENSLNRRGASLVEIVSTCNAGWKMSPADANKWMQENMFPYYPLGDLKNTTAAE
jgi:2-oxoglutarate ferredoxin oxidoreductase subunit beta